MMGKINNYFEKILEKLSSPKLFFRLSIFVSIHFYIAVMGIKGGVDPDFKKLNNHILIDWIRDCSRDHIIISVWLFIAFILLFILGLNISARVFNEFRVLVKMIKKSDNGFDLKVMRKVSVFLIHLSFIFMLGIHFISSVSGTKLSMAPLKKGKILSHPELSFELQCLEIEKSAKKYLKPKVLLKKIGREESRELKIPGWDNGYYYNVSAGYINTKIKKSGQEKTIKRIGLKLIVNNVHVMLYLAAASLICTAGFFMHIFMRPEVLGLIKKRQFLPS